MGLSPAHTGHKRSSAISPYIHLSTNVKSNWVYGVLEYVYWENDKGESLSTVYKSLLSTTNSLLRAYSALQKNSFFWPFMKQNGVYSNWNKVSYKG